MKRVEPEAVGDVLRMAIEHSQMAVHLDELHAADFWPAIAGPDIAAKCGRPFIQNGKMSIRVPDASLRQELTMSRSLIIREFNRLAGKDVVKSLRFSS